MCSVVLIVLFVGTIMSMEEEKKPNNFDLREIYEQSKLIANLESKTKRYQFFNATELVFNELSNDYHQPEGLTNFLKNLETEKMILFVDSHKSYEIKLKKNELFIQMTVKPQAKNYNTIFFWLNGNLPRFFSPSSIGVDRFGKIRRVDSGNPEMHIVKCDKHTMCAYLLQHGTSLTFQSNIPTNQVKQFLSKSQQRKKDNS